MPKSIVQIVSWLKQYGYLPNVPWSEVSRMDSSRELLVAATRMQLFYGSRLLGHPDGVVGPRTLEAMEIPRCGHPDFTDDPELDANRKVLAAGSGSWPASCHETGIRVSIDTSNAPLSQKDIEYIWSVTQSEYSKVGARLVRVGVGDNAHIRQSWRDLGGSTIGLAEFNNRSCRDSVFNYRSSSYRAAINYQINLDMHETAHNCNVEHTSSGIMAPTINDSRNAWVEFDSKGRITYRDPSYTTLARFFGGRPIDEPYPPEPPDPPPPPPPPPEPPEPPLPPDPPEPPVPPDPYGILTVLTECIQNWFGAGVAEQVIVQQLKNPGPRQQFWFEQRVRRQLRITPREWRRKRARIMAPYYNAARDISEDEIREFIRSSVDRLEN